MFDIKNATNPLDDMVFEDIRAGIVFMMHQYTTCLDFKVSTAFHDDAVFCVHRSSDGSAAELMSNGTVIEFNTSDIDDFDVASIYDVECFYTAQSHNSHEAHDSHEGLHSEELLEVIRSAAKETIEARSLYRTRVKTYFFRNEITGLIKIGKSASPKIRLNQIRGIVGAELSLIGVVDGDIEFDLHCKFKKYRQVGEWFEDRDGLIAEYIRKSGKE